MNNIKINRSMGGNYVAPQIEVIEVEIEGAILSNSNPSTRSTSINTVSDGGRSW